MRWLTNDRTYYKNLKHQVTHKKKERLSETKAKLKKQMTESKAKEEAGVNDGLMDSSFHL